MTPSMRFAASWMLYALGKCFYSAALLKCSMRMQGIFGFKYWPWKEGDLWQVPHTRDRGDKT